MKTHGNGMGTKFVLAAMLALWAPASVAMAAEGTGAIGQIVPTSGFIDISGIPSAVVTSIRVHPGQQVKKGDLLMTLQNADVAADYQLAQTILQNTKDQTDQQIAAQDMAVQIASEKLAQANRDYAAYRVLGSSATSTKEMNALKLEAATAKLSLAMEQAKQKIVRAQAAIDLLTAQRRAAVAATASEVRAPSDGTILRINHSVGERLSGDPLIRMADLRSMDVTCQVYEADLLRLTPGMKATIKSPALNPSLTGTVRDIGRMVDAHAKLGDIRIRLDKASPADRLVGMEVEVVVGR